MKHAYINELGGIKPDRQEEIFTRLGIASTFREEGGEIITREVLDQVLDKLVPGDHLVVYSIKTFPVSTIELIDLLAGLHNKGVFLETIEQGILDLSYFKILSDFHFFVKSERSKKGIRSAKARGRNGGRKKGLSKEAQATAKAAAKLYRGGDMSINLILSSLNIGSRATLYRYLRSEGIVIGKNSKNE